MATPEQPLFVDDFGSGAAVVLFHGTPTSPDDLLPLVDALRARHRVLVPHMPGYGRTPPDGDGTSLERDVARVEDHIAHLGIASVDAVAFSGGAYRALAMALRRRVAVARLSLLAPVVGFDPHEAQATRDMVAAVRSGLFDPRPTWLDRMASAGFGARNPLGAARVLSWLDAAPMSVLCNELAAIADAPDLRPRIGELACPLFVCVGSDDRAVPVASCAAIAAASHNATFRVIDGAGHALLAEAPDSVVAGIVAFLEEAP